MINSQRCNQGIKVMIVGLLINLGLSLLKLYIGVSSYSIAILSDAINNFSDAIACTIAIFTFYFMKKNSDESLPYGYGRLEYIASMIMSLIILIVGLYFAYYSLERMFYPFFLTFTWLSFWLVASTVVVKLLMGVFYSKCNKTLESDVIKTSSLDSFMDAGITTMALIGYAFTTMNALRLDAIFGLIISAIIIFNGIKLFVNNIKTLLGKSLEKEKIEELNLLCSEYKCIEKVVRINIHNYGANYVELVLEVVLTQNLNYDIIKAQLDELVDKINEKYKVTTKICIAR
jgi:cation diffusion facilitator family transporter